MDCHRDIPTRTLTYTHTHTQWGDGSWLKTKIHLHIRLSSLLLVKIYLNKIFAFLCLQSHVVHSWFSSGSWRAGQEDEEQRPAGPSPTSAFSTPCWEAGCSRPDLDPCFHPHITFVLSPQHNPRPDPLKRMVVIPPHFPCPCLGLQAESSEHLHSTAPQPDSVLGNSIRFHLIFLP